MQNHLFIGLGGQGGTTIAELRKVFDTRKDAMEELANEHQFLHDFLYIDSSSDVTNDRNIWSHFGRSVRLPDNRHHNLGAAQNLNLGDLALDPGIAPWLGAPADAADHLGLDQLRYPGANQKRRLGRILFSQNADPIRDRICNEILPRMLQNAGRCAFHIFASLAGGTGSGSLIDLITMLRTQFPDPTLETGSPIFVYVYVTASDFANANVGYFHENQYATLRDLNALMSGRYQPHLLAHLPGGTRFGGDFPANQVILVSDVNAGNQVVPLDRQIRITAEAAFERMYLYASNQLNVNAQRSLTGEDLLATFPGEPREVGRVQRSYRFGALGMRRWEVPVEETTEMLVRKLSTQSLNKLLYQNWANNIGALDQLPLHEPRLDSTVDGLMKTIIKPALTSDRLLPKMSKALERAVKEISKRALLQPNGEELDFLDRETDTFFQGGLLDQGAGALFQQEQHQNGTRVNQLMETIQNALIEVWSNRQNALGIATVPRVIDALRTSVVGKMAEIQRQNDEAAANNHAESRNRLRKDEWKKMTALSRPFLAEKLIVAFGEDFCQCLMVEARVQASRLDNDFLNGLLQCLQALSIQYQQAIDRLKEIRRWSDDRAAMIQQSVTHLAAEQGANRYEVSTEHLQDFLRQFTLDQDGVHEASTRMAEQLRQTCQNFGVAALANYQVGSGCELFLAVEADLFTIARARHHALVGQHALQPILSGDLLDVLQQRWQANPEALNEEFNHFINGASALVRVDQGQTQPTTLLGIGNVAPMPRRVFALGLPAGHGFAQTLEERFNQFNFPPNTLRYVYQHNDRTQIRLLAMTSWMGLRFATLSHQLKVKFDTCLQGPAAGNVRYCCNLDPEGERGDKRPQMLLPSAAEVQASFDASLWLGRRIQLPGTTTNVVVENNGNRFLMSLNENGQENQNDITGQTANYNLCPRLLTVVEDALGACNPEQKQQLREELGIDGNQFTPGTVEFGQWTRIRDQVLELLNTQ